MVYSVVEMRSVSSTYALNSVAPQGAVTDYDRHQLALYAALLDAEAAGTDWRESAIELMHLDPDQAGARLCWQSHLDRARWIVGEGLSEAVATFGS
jgi:hypothetical protein